MIEVSTLAVPDREILDAAKMVAGMMWQEFDCIENETVGRIDQRNPEYNILGGSVRAFYTEDVVRKSTIGVLELCIEDSEGGDVQSEHLLVLHLEHSYEDYLFKINLDTGALGIETSRIGSWYLLGRYPAIRQRVLGSLAVVADALW